MIAAAVWPASALVLASASSVRSSVALAAVISGCGATIATPVACAFVSGAVRMTLLRFVAVPAACALVSGALRMTFGAGAAGGPGRWRLTETTSWLAPLSSTIG